MQIPVSVNKEDLDDERLGLGHVFIIFRDVCQNSNLAHSKKVK